MDGVVRGLFGFAAAAALRLGIELGADDRAEGIPGLGRQTGIIRETVRPSGVSRVLAGRSIMSEGDQM
jgi:hypothetical protein